MKLSVKELKAFKQNASHIKSNHILPICGYLKFQDNTVTKHAMHAACIQDIKCSERCLISENVLFSFIEGCHSEEIAVKIDEKSVTLIDKNRKIISPTAAIEHFPRADFSGEGQIDIPNECGWAIKEAAQFCATNKDASHMDYVYVGNRSVGATNGTIIYTKDVGVDLSKMVLSREIIGIAFKLDDVKVSQSDRHYFFQWGNVRYIFLKTDQSFWGIGSMGKMPEDIPKIEVNKSEIIAFNDLCIATSASMLSTVKMSSNKKNFDLQMADSAAEVYPSALILANAQPFETFTYLPRHMNTLLKSISDDELVIYRGDHKLYITGESGAITIISEVV